MPGRNNDARLRILWTELTNQLATSSAWRDNLGTAHCHDRVDLGLSGLQHLSDRGMFGTEAKAAGSVDADSRVKATGPAEQSRGYATRNTVWTGSELTD